MPARGLRRATRAQVYVAVVYVALSFNSDIVMNERIQPRPIQKELAELAYEQNVIVHMYTGGGKTLIAVMLIDHFLSLYPEKRIVFAVNSIPLMQQQARRIREQSRLAGSMVDEVSGETTETWTAQTWSKAGRVSLGPTKGLDG